MTQAQESFALEPLDEAVPEAEEEGTAKSKIYEILWGRNGYQQPVTGDDIRHGIKELKESGLKVRLAAVDASPYSFHKDFTRTNACNRNWPQSLRRSGVTARQCLVGEGVFNFVPFDDVGASEQQPFPNPYDAGEETAVETFENNFPKEARPYGRTDEPWMLTVILHHNLIDTHLKGAALRAGLDVARHTYLQHPVKGQPCEIDIAFSALMREDGVGLNVYMTGEAKTFGERILADQIRGQVLTAFRQTSRFGGELAVSTIIPWVFQVVERAGDRGIYIVQFQPVSRTTFDAENWDKNPYGIPLRTQSNAIYRPSSPMIGISRFPKIRISPSFSSTFPGESQGFSAQGGTGSYVWAIQNNNSGGSISDTGLYTAGTTGNVVDTITVADSANDKSVSAAKVAVRPSGHRQVELMFEGINNETDD